MKKATKSKAAKGKSDPLCERQKAFCRHFAFSYNGTQAAISAGYSPKSARFIASDQLTKPNIQAKIQELRAQRAEEISQSENELIARWGKIVTGDPSEVVSIRRCACRYCHGTDHAFQWRTDREFESGVLEFENLPDKRKAKTLEPSDSGGFGYRRTLDPHPDCPECDGDGHTYVHITPTDELSDTGKAMLQSVQQTPHGIKVTLASRTDALKELSKIKGIYKQPNGNAASALGAWIKEIQVRGSKPPLANND